jgi:hypothetical protein
MIVKTDEDSKDVDDSKDDNGDDDNYSNDDNGDDADNDSNDDVPVCKTNRFSNSFIMASSSKTE